MLADVSVIARAKIGVSMEIMTSIFDIHPVSVNG